MTVNSPSRAVFIEGCDFESYPIGGHLSNATNVLAAIGTQFSLVGVTIDDTPVGKWTEVTRQGVRYKFFSVGRVRPTTCRPLIPARVTFLARLLRYKRQILKCGIRSVLVGSPEALLAVHNWAWDTQVYISAGVSNPVLNSRYNYAHHIARCFDWALFRALMDVNAVIAHADEDAVAGMLGRSRGRLNPGIVHQSVTVANSNIFRPLDRETQRSILNIDTNGPVAVSVGRLNRVKGWDLILEACAIWTKSHPDASLYLVGDGEDRPQVEDAIRSCGLEAQVHVTGFLGPERVAAFVNAADLVVMGSHDEGWPTALVEAMACGKPVVTTNVSGARKIVRHGENGFILPTRDSHEFADAMSRALALPSAQKVSLEVARSYSLERLRAELISVLPCLE